MNYQQALHELEEKILKEKRGFAQKFLDEMQEAKTITLRGGGAHGKNWYTYLKKLHINVDYICDQNPSHVDKRIFSDATIISPRELEQLKGTTKVVITTGNFLPIEKELSAIGIHDFLLATPNLYSFNANLTYHDNREKLGMMMEETSRLFDLFSDDASRLVIFKTIESYFFEDVTIPYTDNQYFHPSIMTLSHDENFVDVGAFDGDTLGSFLKMTNNKFTHIHALEIETHVFQKLKEHVQALPRAIREKISLYNCGAYDEEKDIFVAENGTSTSVQNLPVVEENIERKDEKIKLKKLDDLLKDEEITLLKMDIEGSEEYALKGAKNIIQKNLPKLAICTYHRPEDLWNLPKIILSYSDDYVLKLRHHEHNECETVCYALLH